MGVPGGYLRWLSARAVTDHGEASSGDRARARARVLEWIGHLLSVRPSAAHAAPRARLTGALRRSRSGASCQRSPRHCRRRVPSGGCRFISTVRHDAGPVLISVIGVACAVRGRASDSSPPLTVPKWRRGWLPGASGTGGLREMSAGVSTTHGAEGWRDVCGAVGRSGGGFRFQVSGHRRARG